MPHILTPDLASRFASIALGHITREYPGKLDHVMAGPADVLGPRELHPIFYGSFDWHSCVHGWWLLARLRRLHPDLPQAAQIAALFHGHLTPQNILAELAYLDRPESRGFERPYGWAWLLMLAAEFSRDITAEGQTWTATLRPMADAFAARLVQFLPRAIYPIRTGTHSNTAFATALAWEYATVLGDEPLMALLAATAVSWYGRDVDCQAWEPSLDDFLSPALIEAECMRRILPAPAAACGTPGTAILMDHSGGEMGGSKIQILDWGLPSGAAGHDVHPVHIRRYMELSACARTGHHSQNQAGRPWHHHTAPHTECCHPCTSGTTQAQIRVHHHVNGSGLRVQLDADYR